MQTTVKTLPKSQVQITVVLSEGEMTTYMEKAAKEISHHVRIDGFRPGHVPFSILKQKVGEEAILNHAIDLALPVTYSDAVLKEKVQAISRPKINLVKPNPLEFEATVAVYPEVKVPGYEKISVPKKEVKVEESDVDNVLNEVQRSYASYHPVDRAAKKGDKVEINFEGFDEGGAPLENTQSKNHPLVIGEETLVKGFEDELIGMKAGDKKSFKITFPKDYFHKPFQDKSVEFKVEMNKVEEISLPEWTSEFIQKILGEEKTLDEIKQITKDRLKHDKERDEIIRRENEFLEKIAEVVDVEIPEALIEEEIDGMIDEFKNELSQRNIALDDYLAANKKEIKDLRETRRKEAEKRLRLRFGLQEIFKLEKMEVTPEELDKEIEHLLELYPPKERYSVRKEYKEGSYLRTRLQNKLRMDKLFKKYLEI